MITIIYAPPRTGKTCLLSYILNETCFDRQRTKNMYAEIRNKNENGFSLSYPMHTVSANYPLTFKKFGYSPRTNRFINPYRLGYVNDYVETHFTLPYECIGITEAQKYLNSHMALYFPDWQSRFYEQHGHNNIDIYLDTQRPMLINANVRELAKFIEVMRLDIKRDKNGKIIKMQWHVRKIENSSVFDKYIASGKTDNTLYESEIITANYNVFALYDSQGCKPKFYDGHFGSDFDMLQAECPEETVEGYMEYLRKFDDELPSGYYQKRSNKT